MTNQNKRVEEFEKGFGDLVVYEKYGKIKFFLLSALQSQRQEIAEWAKERPRQFPERESDEYDKGYGQALDEIISHVEKGE